MDAFRYETAFTMTSEVLCNLFIQQMNRIHLGLESATENLCQKRFSKAFVYETLNSTLDSTLDMISVGGILGCFAPFQLDFPASLG